MMQRPGESAAGGAGYQPDYAAPPSLREAVVAMVVGLCLLPVPLAGIVAVVLGVRALRRIGRDPLRYAGKGYAIIGVISGVAGTLVTAPILALLLLPSFESPRGRAPRSICAANLRGLVSSCVVYAAGEGGMFPTAGVPAAAGECRTDCSLVSSPQPDAATAMKEVHSKAAGNPLASVWMLVLNGQMASKSLMCRDDPAVAVRPSRMVASAGGAGTAGSGGTYFLTPEAPGQISYAIGYPWNGAGPTATLNYWWRDTIDSEVPVAADIGPLNGSGIPPRTPAPAALPRSGAEWNSFNHGGKGQNVAFGDAHVEWLPTPVTTATTGHKDDIWSVGEVGKTSDGTGGMAGAAGRVPVPAKGWATAAPFDVIMVPVRDGPTGMLR